MNFRDWTGKGERLEGDRNLRNETYLEENRCPGNVYVTERGRRSMVGRRKSPSTSCRRSPSVADWRNSSIPETSCARVVDTEGSVRA